MRSELLDSIGHAMTALGQARDREELDRSGRDRAARVIDEPHAARAVFERDSPGTTGPSTPRARHSLRPDAPSASARGRLARFMLPDATLPIEPDWSNTTTTTTTHRGVPGAPKRRR
jgi:hypothetical protein